MNTRTLHAVPAFLVAIFVLVFTFFWGSTYAHAAHNCTFERDLDTGIEGEDVLCLQKFLNEEGNTLATEGPGAPGSETDRFGSLTRAALALWQEDNDVYPASGYFGPYTRAAMDGTSALAEVVDTEDATAPSSGIGAALGGLSAEDQAEAQQLLTLLESLGLTGGSTGSTAGTATVDSTTSVYTAGGTEKDLRTLLVAAIRAMRDANELIKEGNENDEVIIAAREDFGDATYNLMDAIEAYFTGDLVEAFEHADDAYDNAADALVDVGGEVADVEEDEEEDEEDANDEVTDDRFGDIEEVLDDAWDEVEEANDDGDDTSDAEEYLDDAERVYDDAEEAREDGEHGEASDFLDEVESMIDDALGTLGSSSGDDEEDADEAIDDADEAIDDAYDAVNEASDDGEDVEEAEDLLDDAENALDDAVDAYDDGDYEDAIEYAEDAEDLAERAMDEL